MCRPGRRRCTSTPEILERFTSAPATAGHAVGWYTIDTCALGMSAPWSGCYPTRRVAEGAPAARRTGSRGHGFTARRPTSPAPQQLRRDCHRLKFPVNPCPRRGWRRDRAWHEPGGACGNFGFGKTRPDSTNRARRAGPMRTRTLRQRPRWIRASTRRSCARTSRPRSVSRPRGRAVSPPRRPRRTRRGKPRATRVTRPSSGPRSSSDSATKTSAPSCRS